MFTRFDTIHEHDSVAGCHHGGGRNNQKESQLMPKKCATARAFSVHVQNVYYMLNKLIAQRARETAMYG